jgi:hypothetical protein
MVEMKNKRNLKIGVAAMAIAALIIGLSVGLSQNNKNTNVSSSNASNTFQTYVDGCDHSGKSGKSGGKSGKSGGSYSGSGKSGKSGSSSSSDGKSGKSGGRALAVPGTEDYEQVTIKSNPVRRRKLRNELIKGKLLLLMMFLGY